MIFTWVLFVLTASGPEPVMGFKTEAGCESLRARTQWADDAGKSLPSVCRKVSRA
jgi:hypothetical protein